MDDRARRRIRSKKEVNETREEPEILFLALVSLPFLDHLN